jgi:hypothetical protein
MQRTTDNLISAVASKCEVDPARVQRTVRVDPNGLHILVDGEVVREMPEGQDMMIEFKEIVDQSDSMVKDEQAVALTASNKPADGQTTPLGTTPLEMRLFY